MLAVRPHAGPHQLGRSRRDRCGPIAAARSPAALALGLQRTAGNRAVASALAPRMRIARTPQRAEVKEPGTGYDGILKNYGDPLADRKTLSSAQKAAVREYRAWMEGTFSQASGYDQSRWAREAGSRAARFPGDAAARANLYAEFQRQIVQATGGGASSWKVSVELGADGSYIFRGNPNLEKQRVFVVDRNGNCYAGLADEALSGRGAGKTVNYDKLYKVGTVTPPTSGGTGGGGGGTGGTTPKTEPSVKPAGGTAAEPPVTRKTAEPPTTGPKVEPAGKPTTSGGARMGPGSAAEGGKLPRFSLRGAGGFIALTALFWWLGSRGEKAEKESLDKIMREKVEPKAQEAFKAKAAEADRINAQSPEFELHAIITVDFDYSWEALGIGGTPTREHVYDARFVSLELGGKMKDSKTTVLRHDKETSLLGSDTYHDATRRVTWSVPLHFDETKQQRRYRSHLKSANEVIRKGWSARKAAESQHFDRGPDRSLSRKDIENQKYGIPTEADVLEMLDRELFVRAYIEMIQYYDADELLRDAQAYLAELQTHRARAMEGGPQLVKKPAPLVPLGSR